MLRIGELAERAGVATSAVRFYESRGLLEADGRVAGQRRYRPDAVDRLRMIVLLRRAGLSCADVAQALDRSPARTAVRRERATARAAELREQVLTTLSALVVVEHATHCTRAGDDDSCVAEIRAQRDDAVARAARLLDDLGRPDAPLDVPAG
jgi:DNA-binding transcriptional MerR regulator